MGAWSYTAFYPYVSGTSSDATTASIPFGNIRTQQGNAYNSAYDALVAEPVSVTAASPAQTDAGKDIAFRLHRLTSILYFELTSSEHAADPIRSVTLEADRTLSAGELLFRHKIDAFDLAQVNARLTDAEGAYPQKNITITFEDGTAPAAADCRAYFNILPAAYGEFRATVRTDTHKASLTLNPSFEFVAGKMYRKKAQLTGWTELQAPQIVWQGNPDFARQEITDPMTVDVDFTSDYGFQSFTVDIVSPVLTEEVLGLLSLTSHLDLINPANAEQAATLRSLGFPTGDQVLGRNRASFSIGTLVPYIMGLASVPSSDHDFVVTVTDTKGNTLTRTLGFHCTAPDTYAASVNMWDRSALLTTATASAGTVQAEYRVKGTEAWKEVAVVRNGNLCSATVAPTWTATTNDAGLTVHTFDPATAVSPATTYEYRFIIDGTASAVQTFTTPAGDTIVNAGMDDWTTYNVTGSIATGGTVSCPNKDNTDMFWTSGNNKSVSGLCAQATAADAGSVNGCAKLKGGVAVNIFAPGNLFSGNMQFGTGLLDMFGYADFGQPYVYTARPSYLKVRIKAAVTPVEYIGSKDPMKSQITVGSTADPIRIFVCITSWNARHRVQSGKTLDANTFWDPEKQNSTGEGAIVAYGSLTQTASIDEWTDVEIPILYYDREAGVPDAAYSFVFSAATSARGDYLTGSASNTLYIDNIEWGY